MSVRDHFLEELARLDSGGLYRSLETTRLLEGGKVRVGEAVLLNLSSNDYLGLSLHPELKKAAMAAAEALGVGAGASRLVSGNHPLYELLEEKVARFKKTEAALVFSSGYMANIGLLSALVNKDDRVFSDELNHASIIDGLRIARGRVFVYRHGDADHLEKLLKETAGSGRAIIVTDGVFSMDGDLAPLPDLVYLKEKYGAFLVVDDAHATGVMGENGRGVAEHFHQEGRVEATVGTFSKALGSFGAFVAGSGELKDYLVNRARSLIFSTGLPPTLVAVNLAALTLVEERPDLRQSLHRNVRHLAKFLAELGFDVKPSETPILPLIVGESAQALALARELSLLGVYTKAIRPPTVAPGTARIRLTASALHGERDLDMAREAFRLAREKLPW
jgi:8-amino-7-oxononanoate synthase